MSLVLKVIGMIVMATVDINIISCQTDSPDGVCLAKVTKPFGSGKVSSSAYPP